MIYSKILGFSGVLIASLVGAWAFPSHAASVATPAAQQVPSTDTREAAPAAASVRQKDRVTMTGGPFLGVQVTPALPGPGAWQFTLERRSGGAWTRVDDYHTQGTLEELALPVPTGTYRVVVPAQNGYPAAKSLARRYIPKPEVTVGGYGAVEVTVGPEGNWVVTLERKTVRGWVASETAMTHGASPVSFSVPAGKYRARTKAQGRFPAYTSAPFRFEPQAPEGPVSYERIEAIFSGPALSTSTASSSSNCASAMQPSAQVGYDLFVGAINLIPDVGGAIASQVPNWSANSQDAAEQACLSAEFSTINAQLSFQEGQIQQIQNQLNEDMQVFEAYKQAVAIQNLSTNQSTFYDDVQQFTATGSTNNQLFEVSAACINSGLTYDFMFDFGFWSGCQTVSTATPTVQEIATSTNFANLAPAWATNNQDNFQSYLGNVSGSEVVNCDGNLLPNLPGAAQPDCHKDVQSDTGSDLFSLLQSLAAVLNSSMNVNLGNTTNVVPLFDNYNNYLVSYFQQSVAAIQAAYTMESLVNQLNYYNAAGNTPIAGSLGNVPGTYYSYQLLQSTLGYTPSALQQLQYYNQAQKALTQLYAARMNQLYLVTIGFIVTDDPKGEQTWPTCSDETEEVCKLDQQINGTNVGALVTTGENASRPTASTPLGMLPTIATSGLAWEQNAVLYQYYGLRDAGQCYDNLLQWNKDNGTAVQGKNGTWYSTAFPSQNELTQAVYDKQCPPILTTAAGGAVTAPATAPDSSTVLNTCATYANLANGAPGSCYDGNSLVPYYVGSDELPGLGSAVLTNLVLCNSGDPALTWFLVTSDHAGNAAGLIEGDMALTCGNWASPAYDENWPGDAFPQSTGPSWWGNPTAYSCINTSSSSPSYCGFGQNPLIPSTGLWGPFQSGDTQPAADEFLCNSGIRGYIYTSTSASSVPGYFDVFNPQNSPAYVSPASPLNIGGTGAATQVTVDSTNCSYPYNNTLEGCTLTFDSMSSDGGNEADQYVPAQLVVLSVSLPNTATGSQAGGFDLPMTLGATVWNAPGSPLVYPCGNDKPCTLVEAWVPSNTNIAVEGYYAPPSILPPQMECMAGGVGAWEQSGYITVADGSCWAINVGRNSDNVGTISFNQVTPGSLCAP